MGNIENLLHSKAVELGFDRLGITSAEPIPENKERFQKWLADGYQGQMNYLAKEPSRRQDPRKVLPGARVRGKNQEVESPVMPGDGVITKSSIKN